MRSTRLKDLKELNFEQLEHKLRTQVKNFVASATDSRGVTAMTRLVSIVSASPSVPHTIPLKAWNVYQDYYVVENGRCAKKADESLQTSNGLMKLQYCMFKPEDADLMPCLIHEINQSARQKP